MNKEKTLLYLSLNYSDDTVYEWRYCLWKTGRKYSWSIHCSGTEVEVADKLYSNLCDAQMAAFKALETNKAIHNSSDVGLQEQNNEP